MGEAKDAGKNEGEKKADAGKKDDGGATPIVLKFDMHCEGCVKKVKRFVRSMDGVENVKADIMTNKLTVGGKTDPAKLRDRLAEKTGKKVELISPLPKKADGKDGGGGGGGGDKKSDDKAVKKPEDKSEKKTDNKKADDNKPKEAPVSTVVLKMRLHCEGCIQKMKRVISKYKGVEMVSVEALKDLVTVKGKMDAKTLVPYLTERLRRPIDIVPAKKDAAAAAGGDKKEKGGDDKGKESAGGDGEKKEKAVTFAGVGEEKGGGGGGGKVEANKMDYYGSYGYHQPAPSYWYGGGPEHVYGHPMEAGPSHSEVPPHQNYAVDHYIMPPHPAHAPQIFSDENPNACSVM